MYCRTGGWRGRGGGVSIEGDPKVALALALAHYWYLKSISGQCFFYFFSLMKKGAGGGGGGGGEVECKLGLPFLVARPLQ